ncbi:MAG TPA: efflux RND transporter periplasmic adaptor subunit [Microvirga sp.]|nr:efflux RND transporter periplasmic adaptor subunit [Microvirga sp.]
MRRSWLVPLGASAAAVGVALTPNLLPPAAGTTPAAPAMVAPPVEVGRPEARRHVEALEALGRLEAVETAEIRARVGGVVEEVAFRDGDLVRQGDLLFRIDPRPYRIALDQAHAALRQKSEQLKLAASRRKRAGELAERAVASQDAYEAAVAQEATLAAEVEAGKAAVAAAALNLEYTEVKAPISGRIGATTLTRGNHVTAASAGGAPLATIVAVDPIRVAFNIDEASFLKHLARHAAAPEKAGIKAAVGLVADEEKPRSGAVEFVDPVVDRSTGTVRVRAVLPNRDGSLAPGLFARVRLELGAARDAVVVDERAVAAGQGGRFVLVVGADDQVEARPVTLGATVEPGKRLVLSGLTPEDRVVLKGLARPGMKVSPIATVASAASGDRP